MAREKNTDERGNTSLSHGAYPRVISRHDLMQTLHDGLPAEAREKLIPSKKVVDVVTDPDGVTVTCADGSTYTGTVCIGADGAHSKVRGVMRNLALKEAAEAAAAAGGSQAVKVNEEKPFLTT